MVSHRIGFALAAFLSDGAKVSKFSKNFRFPPPKVENRLNIRSKLPNFAIRYYLLTLKRMMMNNRTSESAMPQSTKRGTERNGVFHFMDRQILQLKRCNQLGTAHNYERARNSFYQFMEGREIPFRALNEPLVEGYNKFLTNRGLLRNTISFYMRIWRAVYNKAAAQHLARRNHPFHHVYTGVDYTQKRAVDERQIIRLKGLKLPCGSGLDFARDLFIFSYCTRGMAFVDIAHLRKAEVRSGTIRYARKKTRQPLTIRIEGPIRTLIDKYATANPYSPYLFPILRGEGAEEDYQRYRIALNRHNQMLRKLAEMLPGKCHLSSYTPRHSWATAARNHNIPISVISAGLGHSSERTTEIYLATLDNSRIDAANKELLRRLK